jgi:hypothetical protein
VKQSVAVIIESEVDIPNNHLWLTDNFLLCMWTKWGTE